MSNQANEETNDGVAYHSKVIGSYNYMQFGKDIEAFMAGLNPVVDTIISVSHSSAPYKSPNTYKNDPIEVLLSVVIVWKHIP